MSRYRFVAAEKAAARNVAKACVLLSVSRSAYYHWSQQRLSAHARRATNLVGEMGTGRTTIGTAAATLAGFERVLVLCPPHLVRKWQREVKATDVDRAVAAGAVRGRYNRRTMTITVLFFAGLADRVGLRRMELPHVAGDTVASVRDRIVAEHRVIADFVPNLVYAIDEEYADEREGVPDGATLALIPPVSGGE